MLSRRRGAEKMVPRVVRVACVLGGRTEGLGSVVEEGTEKRRCVASVSERSGTRSREDVRCMIALCCG